MTRYYAIPVGKRALVKDGRLFRWMVNGVQDTIRGPENLKGWSPIDKHDPWLSAPFPEAWDRLCDECGPGPVPEAGMTRPPTSPPDGRYWLVGPGVVRCDGPNHPLPPNPDEYCCPRCDGTGFLNPLGLASPELWAEDDAELRITNERYPFVLSFGLEWSPHALSMKEFARKHGYAGIRIISDDGSREDIVR